MRQSREGFDIGTAPFNFVQPGSYRLKPRGSITYAVKMLTTVHWKVCPDPSAVSHNGERTCKDNWSVDTTNFRSRNHAPGLSAF